jgi:protocatechuate 3,4-dioxygenase beta subunit
VSRNLSRVSAIVVVILFAVPLLHAMPQASAHRASLDGVVLGTDGKPVPNAIVTYQSGGGDTPHAVHTDAHGRFRIAKMRGDNYDLRASAHGKYSSWQKNVMVRSGSQNTLTLQLTDNGEIEKAAIKRP